MIVSAPDCGRPKLDRDILSLIRQNESTKEAWDSVAPELPLTDTWEAGGELLREDPTLRQRLAERALLVAARNKKRPTFGGVRQAPQPLPVTLSPSGPDLWAPLVRTLKDEVSVQNFENFLSGVSFLGVEGQRVHLEVPNTWFVEYLTDHYKGLIEETLLSHHKLSYEVVFVARAEAPQYAAPEAPPRLDQVETPTKEAPSTPVKEPETIKELEQLFAKEEIEVAVQRDKEIEQWARDSGGSLSYLPAKRKANEPRWAAEDLLRRAAQRRRKEALIAKLFPVLTQGPGPVDHVEEFRAAGGKGVSAFEGTTRTTQASGLRELRSDEKRRPKPDTS